MPPCAALAAAPVLLVGSARASRRAKATPVAGRTTDPDAPPPRNASAAAAVGLAVVVLAVALGVAVDPAARSIGGSAAAGVEPTGRTTTVEVVAEDMRFTPSTITVPAGDRLVLVVTNDDEDVHDLALDTGDQTERLAAGATDSLRPHPCTTSISLPAATATSKNGSSSKPPNSIALADSVN